MALLAAALTPIAVPPAPARTPGERRTDHPGCHRHEDGGEHQGGGTQTEDTTGNEGNRSTHGRRTVGAWARGARSRHTGSMKSTMQDAPLLISDILRYGQEVHGDSTVITVETGGHRSATFTEVATRAEKLAKALRRLGVKDGDRVGTFCWNNQGHLEAYLAIPCMGAVLHTLNIRLPAEQLAYVINHAEDRVIIVDASLIPLLAAVKDELKTVETIIVAGEGDTSALGETLSYERLLAAEEPGFEWPELDERSAAAMCYTSGTTGNPKGRGVLAPLHLLAHHGRAVGLFGGHDREGPHPHHRPHVPRQRVGDPLRRLAGGDRHRSCPRCS